MKLDKYYAKIGWSFFTSIFVKAMFSILTLILLINRPDFGFSVDIKKGKAGFR